MLQLLAYYKKKPKNNPLFSKLIEWNSNLKELLKKLTRNHRLKIVHEEEQLQIILDQLNVSDDLQVNNQQTLDVFKPLSGIIPQESRYQIEEESKEEVKEEINLDRSDESLTNAQLIKLSKEDKAKRYNRVEIYFPWAIQSSK